MIERWLSGFFLLVSALYVYFASDLNFGTLAKPKVGFLPHLVGYLALILCIINFSQLMSKKLLPGEGKIDLSTLKNILLVLAGSCVYIFLLSKIGYLAATMLFLFYLFKITQTKGYIMPGIIAVSVVGVFYFCFSVLLGVNLP